MIYCFWQEVQKRPTVEQSIKVMWPHNFLVIISVLRSKYVLQEPETGKAFRHGSTPVSTVLRKSVTLFIINIFNGEKSFQVARLHLRRMELDNILSERLRNPGKDT